MTGRRHDRHVYNRVFEQLERDRRESERRRRDQEEERRRFLDLEGPAPNSTAWYRLRSELSFIHDRQVGREVVSLGQQACVEVQQPHQRPPSTEHIVTPGSVVPQTEREPFSIRVRVLPGVVARRVNDRAAAGDYEAFARASARSGARGRPQRRVVTPTDLEDHVHVQVAEFDPPPRFDRRSTPRVQDNGNQVSNINQSQVSSISSTTQAPAQAAPIPSPEPPTRSDSPPKSLSPSDFCLPGSRSPASSTELVIDNDFCYDSDQSIGAEDQQAEAEQQDDRESDHVNAYQANHGAGGGASGSAADSGAAGWRRTVPLYDYEHNPAYPGRTGRDQFRVRRRSRRAGRAVAERQRAAAERRERLRQAQATQGAQARSDHRAFSPHQGNQQGQGAYGQQRQQVRSTSAPRDDRGRPQGVRGDSRHPDHGARAHSRGDDQRRRMAECDRSRRS